MSLTKELNEIKQLFDKLKKEYEHFFAGIQKQEPLQLRREVERKIKEISRKRLIQTRDKFLYQSLCASFTSYSALWDRKLKEMMDTSRVEKEMLMKQTGTASGKFQEKKPSPPATDMFDEVARKYLEAHKQLGVKVNTKPEVIKEKVRTTVEKVKKQYGVRKVNVDVKVENGKVKIKVKPVKE